MLDHVLLVDPIISRHQHFVDFIMLEVCQKKLITDKLAFTSYNESFTSILQNWTDCNTKYIALNTHKIPVFSFIYDCSAPRKASQLALLLVYKWELDLKSFYAQLAKCHTNIGLATSWPAKCQPLVHSLLNNSLAHLAAPHFLPSTPPPLSNTSSHPTATTNCHFCQFPRRTSSLPIQHNLNLPSSPDLCGRRRCSWFTLHFHWPL